MKKIITTTVLAASALAFVAAANTASANNSTDYATQYCQFYKNKAKWTGLQYWWDRYYYCLEEYR